LFLTLLVVMLLLKLGTDCPCPRPVNVGVQNDAHVQGDTACEQGYIYTGRVNTG